MLCVCKFGGSSLSTKGGLERIREIVYSSPLRKVIVVSALGKRFSNDIKVTDLLIRLYENFTDTALRKEIISRYEYLKEKSGVNIDIEGEFFNLPYDKDYIVSRGEYLTAKIVASYLNYRFVDASKILYFKRGKLDVLKSRRAILKTDLNGGVVIPGFYVNDNGKIKLLERGGSDLSGAYLCKLLKADFYENYTDVCGIKCVNPNISEGSRTVNVMAYKDLKRLSVLNFQVLHKSTYKPVIGTKTQIIVKNTFDDLSQSTVIKNRYKTKTPKVFGIGQKGDKIIIIGRKLNDNIIKVALSSALHNLGCILKSSYYKTEIATEIEKTVAIKLVYIALKKYV